MSLQRISCVSCGAPVVIPAGVDTLNCAHCGVGLLVQRGEGSIALTLAHAIGQALEGVGAKTQSSIREGTHATQTELRRLQLTQEISTAMLQLSSLRAEIRSLERLRHEPRTSRQLKNLRHEEGTLNSRIHALKAGIDLLGPGSVPGPHPAEGIPLAEPAPAKDWLATFLLCLILGPFGLHRFYSGHILVGVLQLATFGGLGIWWLVDLLLLATNRYRDSRGRPLRNPNAPLGRGCLWSLLAFFVLAVTCTAVATPIDRALFGIDATSDSSGPLATAALLLSMIGAAVVFAYAFKPQAPIWARICSAVRKTRRSQ